MTEPDDATAPAPDPARIGVDQAPAEPGTAPTAPGLIPLGAGTAFGACGIDGVCE